MMDFVPHWATLSAFTVATLALAVTPGPDLTFFLAQSIANGRKAGFAALGGASVGLVVHSVLVAAGLAALLAAAPTLFNILKYVGAAYLAFLAYSVLRHGSGIGETSVKVPKGTARKAFIKALAINLLNPKIIVFFVTFLPQFVSPDDPNAGGTLLFLGIWFILVSVPCIVPMILAADKLSNWLRSSKRVMRLFDWAFAGVMGGFAVRLLVARPPV